MRRFTYMGYGGTPEYAQVVRETVVMLMIEKQSAVEALDDILAVPGIDMIQWGPADFAMSIGKPGELQHPLVKATERKVIEAALKAGIPPRAEIDHPGQAQSYLDMGVKHFNIGTDLGILFDWWKSNGKTMRSLLENR
jgi:4-hydroxy-2-oxoheptanedioate aldolase